MTKYISLLRGINVSGQKKVKMADLKALYEALGYSDVFTYIQSGNVVFEHGSDDSITVKKDIEQAIEKNYGFSVHVDVRVRDEFKNIYAALPFDNVDLEQDGTKILVTFLSENPENQNIEVLNAFVKPPEELIFGNRALYLHCPNGYGKTKLSNAFIEKKLAVTATTRNLKSVLKLCELLDGQGT